MSIDHLRQELALLADEYDQSTTRIYEQAVRASRRSSVARTTLAAAAVVLVASAGTAVLLRPAASPRLDTTVTPVTGIGAPGGPIPAGAIDLSDATLDLPPTGYTGPPAPDCSGVTTFVHRVGKVPTYYKEEPPPAAADRSTARIEQEWAGDVDRDGVPDTLALITCQQRGQGNWQVVAVRNGPHGPVVFAQVVAEGPAPGPTSFFGLGVTGSGDVVAEVGDYGKGLTPAQRTAAAEISTHQRRTYHFDGHTFGQVDGPVTFPPNPHFNQVSLTVATLTYGPVVDGRRSATLVLTVHNDGPAAARDVELNLGFRGYDQPVSGGDWSSCRTNPLSGSESGSGLACTFARVEAGATATLTLGFTAPATVPPAQLVDDHHWIVSLAADDDLGLGVDVDSREGPYTDFDASWGPLTVTTQP